MKCLVLLDMTGAAEAPNPQAVDELAAASKAWVREHSQELEATYTFVEGGGCMIVNVNSPEELHELIHSNPSSPFLSHEIHMVLDFEEGIDRLASHYKSGLERAHGARRNGEG